MAQQASSSSPSISGYTYDVFLSFRGEDTRYGFTGHLYSALSQRGIFTFIDDEALQKGEEITPPLHKAIQESRISIVIFSKNYATSTFCLNELVLILECYMKQNMLIFPVFYDIDPSHVRHQTGSYQEAFAMHEWGRFKDDTETVQKWRLALHLAANLSGWHFKIGEEYESELIKKITKVVSSKLNRRPLHIADYPVGLQAHMQQIQWLMGAESDKKVTMLGIHGMGGIGKSTLARAIYNLIAHEFEGSCFLANVREKTSTSQGLAQIQETILSELVGETHIKLGDVYRGIPILKQRLFRKKVLLVLDDVDKREQLQATAGEPDWFGPKSIIIITTRDKQLLDIYEVDKLYEVNELDDSKALELFRWNAFKNREVDPNYMELINRAVHYARGVPLALEILGSSLFGKALDEWNSALEAYERIPNINVQKVLKVTYDSLDTNARETFLDIACFFSGCTLRYVTYMLDARGFNPKFCIGVLREKSLINIYRYDNEIIVIMHDLVRSMGKEIVREQSNWPTKRNRLWFYEDIACVLEKNTENDKIEAMMLEMPEDEVQWNQKVFVNMKNLRMMLIKKNAGFIRRRKDLPNSLRVLEWWGYPAAALPSNFHSKNLVVLNLSYSYFRWEEPLQNSKVLRHLIFEGCKNIRRIPDISSFPNLKELCVCKCTNLIEIHDSVGCLYNLQRFCADGCTKLKIGPRSIKLTSLEYLSLQDCSSLFMFPDILAPMHKLKYVALGGTSIKNLPLSIQNLEGLHTLSLKGCKMLEYSEPSNFFQKLPEFFPNLKELYLQYSNLTILPACIEECMSLRSIDVSYCKKLQEIKALPPSIVDFSAENSALDANSLTLNLLLRRAIDSTTMGIFFLPAQGIPVWFDHFSRGNSLCFWFRNELPTLIVCAVYEVWDYNRTMDFILFARINDFDLPVNVCTVRYKSCLLLEGDHIIAIKLESHGPYSIHPDLEKAIETNEWICGKLSVAMEELEEDFTGLGLIKWTGVYVDRAFSRMENVRFTDPYPSNNTGDLEDPLNYVYNNLDSKESPCTTNSSNDPDGAFLDHQAMAPSFADTQNAEVQREMGTPISEVSREFTHLSRQSYKSRVSESHKVDEVEAGLETKKNQFSEAMVLVNELQQKLSSIKKMKEDLGDQLSAIHANISAIEANHSSIKANISSIRVDISASQSERNMDCKRIGNIIEEGNTDMNQS